VTGISNFLKDAILNFYFRDGSLTALTNVHVALFSVMPNDAGTGGTELSGTGYARVAVPATNAAWNAPVAGTGTQRVLDNVAAVDFGTSGSAWAPAGTCVGFGIFDASTAGNYIGGNTFGTAVTIESGNPVRFIAGALDIILSGT
jgi:hypothetical protein